MKNLYFIRHGESTANNLKICAGHLDVPLTAHGFKQAQQAGYDLAKSGIHFDLIISSPLLRAHTTAKEIARQLHYDIDGIILRNDAKERYRGEFEGKPTYFQKDLTDAEYIASGAESEEDMAERAKSLLTYINSRPESTVLLVSHNQFGRSFIGYINGKKRHMIERLPHAHAIKLL